jgi:hypothetical protein
VTLSSYTGIACFEIHGQNLYMPERIFPQRLNENPIQKWLSILQRKVRRVESLSDFP